jgi:hypothetical protein
MLTYPNALEILHSCAKIKAKANKSEATLWIILCNFYVLQAFHRHILRIVQRVMIRINLETRQGRCDGLSFEIL